MITGQAAVPSIIAAQAALQNKLETYLGKTVEQFCGKYGKAKDSINHCAHFVGHVLELRVPGAALCSNVGGSKNTYAERGTGFCIRVDQIFNGRTGRARLNADPVSFGPRFVVATVAGNITSEKPLTIGQMPDKHIGIYAAGMVYNYSNSQDKVVKKTIKEFSHHYGKGTVLLVADLP